MFLMIHRLMYKLLRWTEEPERQTQAVASAMAEVAHQYEAMTLNGPVHRVDCMLMVEESQVLMGCPQRFFDALCLAYPNHSITVRSNMTSTIVELVHTPIRNRTHVVDDM